LEKSVFIRKTSGLVRPYGAMDTTLIYTLIIFSILNTTLQFPWFFGFWPGADLVGALAFSMIPMGLLMVVYWAVALAMPRSGSDYVWFARTTHPALGFSWSLVYWYTLVAVGPLTVCFTYGYTVSGALVVWGTLYNAPNLLAFATWLNTQMGSFLFALVLIVVYSVFAILGHKAGKTLLYVSWVIQIFALVLMWYLLGTTDTSVFSGKWDTLMSQYTTYQAVFDTAKSAGWVLAPITLGATVSSVAFTFLLMSGAAQGAGSISGEIRNVNRSIPIALLFSNLFAFVIWSLSAITEVHATGSDWLVALSWLWDNAPNKFPLPLPPSLPLMLGIVTYPNQMLTLIALGSFILANMAFAYILLVTVSRYFFAWAFDRLIPTRLADVNARFKTPHFALIATMVITSITAVLFAFMGFSNFFAASASLFVLCYGAVAVTVVIFPFTRWKTLLDQLPTFMRKKIGGMPFISIIAAITAIILFYAAYSVAANPLLASNFNAAAELFGSIFVLGIAIYLVSKWYNKRQGIDIALIFKEVPPT
jgi:amino acid transporter